MVGVGGAVTTAAQETDEASRQGINNRVTVTNPQHLNIQTSLTLHKAGHRRLSKHGASCNEPCDVELESILK